jgi:hypothetical protein
MIRVARCCSFLATVEFGGVVDGACRQRDNVGVIVDGAHVMKLLTIWRQLGQENPIPFHKLNVSSSAWRRSSARTSNYWFRAMDSKTRVQILHRPTWKTSSSVSPFDFDVQEDTTWEPSAVQMCGNLEHIPLRCLGHRHWLA